MKKLYVILILLTVLVILAACGDTPTTSDDGVITTSPKTTTEAPSTTVPTTSAAPTPSGKLEKTENYTAVLDETEWVADEGVDFTAFTHYGTGSEIAAKIQRASSGYKRTWYKKDASGQKIEIKSSELNKMPSVGAVAVFDDAAKTVTVEITEIEVRVQPSWKEVTAREGSYLMFEFTANLPMNCYITVTATEGGSQASAWYKQGDISVKGGNGSYKGTAKCTVPYDEGKTYYINICSDTNGYPILASVPVHITAQKYDIPYQFIFQGDWDLINDKSYIDNLYEVLINSYPRAYQRWAFSGDEPLVLYVAAEANSEAIAYNAGTKVAVQVGYANSAPDDVGLFAHEFTHAIQSFFAIEYDNGWFTEAMADYGRFRFFHWGYNAKYAKIYSQDNKDIRDFRQHKDDPTSQWHQYASTNYFMAYLDLRWPTTDKNKDGKITPDEHGLIDHIVYEAKLLTKQGAKPVSDYPYTVGSTFNNWVKDITGIATMDLVRQQYVKELDENTYVFTGFRDYVDNFLIEGVYDIPDLIYPMIEKKVPTATTGTPLTAPVLEGENLALGSKVTTAANSIGKSVAANIVDGDLTTRYQASFNKSLVSLNGIQNEIVIDLGSVKTFDTYTLVNAGYSMADNFSTKEWEVLVSEDGKTYTAVDYQKDSKMDAVSVNIGTQKARYVKIYVYTADNANTGTTRILEFMLFKQQ